MRAQSFFLRVIPASVLLAAACGDDTTTTAGSGGAGGDASSSSAAGTTGATQPSSTASTASSSTASSASSAYSGDGGAGGTGGDPSGGGAGGTGGGGNGAGGEPSGGGGAGGAIGSGGGTAICDDVEPSNERVAACAAHAEALCGNYERCSIPIFLFALGGDVEACVALSVAACEAQLNVVEDEYVTCLDDLAAAYDGECSIEVYDFPASCLGIGHLADGEPCFSDFECHNGLCLVDGADCGTCTPLVAEGDACEIDEVCPLPLSCIEGECAPAAPDGTPCDSARDCDGQACVQDECATASYVDLGEPCGGIAVCDPAAELACDDSGSCAANPTPEPGLLGDPCVAHEVDFSGFLLGVELCEPGTTCQDGTCVIAGLPGEPCPDDGVCGLGSACIDQVCEPSDPNLCACGD